MTRIYNSLLLILLAVSFTACFNKERPNYQYFPNVDMYDSPSYETYGEYSIFPDGQSAMKAAEGSIARGEEVYDYPNTMEGKRAAIAELENPLPFTERNVQAGKKMYDIYCAICHGGAGDGNGTLAQREKMMGIPGFDDANRDMSDGNIYHVMYYGLNNMGSYAAQTTYKERWQIIHYINTLIGEMAGDSKREFEKDTTLNRDHYDKEISPQIFTKN